MLFVYGELVNLEIESKDKVFVICFMEIIIWGKIDKERRI